MLALFAIRRRIRPYRTAIHPSAHDWVRCVIACEHINVGNVFYDDRWDFASRQSILNVDELDQRVVAEDVLLLAANLEYVVVDASSEVLDFCLHLLDDFIHELCRVDEARDLQRHSDVLVRQLSNDQELFSLLKDLLHSVRDLVGVGEFRWVLIQNFVLQ